MKKETKNNLMSSPNKIIIGTRGSDLARWQTDFVKDQLLSLFPDLNVEIVVIKTTGDVVLDSSLSEIGGKGVFTKELEDALLSDVIDIAVHSLKDLPTELPQGLQIGAILKRAAVEDVFLSNDLSSKLFELPQGATVATGSIRRKSQILAKRPDINIIDIRGNVPTRIKKLRNSNWDGMILARAGVERLGLMENVAHIIDVKDILPAPGQGAIAIETRVGDNNILHYLIPLNDVETELSVTAERTVLKELGGGCQHPLGTYGRFIDGVLTLDACYPLTGSDSLTKVHCASSNNNATELGETVAKMLKDF